MTTRTRRPGPSRGAPAAALLKPSQAPAPRSVDPDPLAGVELPPLPDTPPPLPEGAKLGFDDAPEGAVRAAPLEIPEDELHNPAEVPVDPTTGEAAEIPEVTRAGASDALRRELELAEQLRATEERAAAAEAERDALRENAPMRLEEANDIGGHGPADQADLELHKRAQAAYRKHRHQQLVNGHQAALVQEPTVEVEVESAEERSARLRAEAKAEYERRVAAMPPDEVVYVVGPRPPRPKIAGHTLSIGDVVPGAWAFPRLESWVSTGILVKRES